jgi:hypothetical protein
MKGGVERESYQSEFDLTIRHRQNGKLSDRVATSTLQDQLPVPGLADFLNKALFGPVKQFFLPLSNSTVVHDIH